MSTHYLIRLLDEQGTVLSEIQDSSGFVDALLVPHAQSRRGLSRHIDPYGTTTFNAAQCSELIDEVQSVDAADPSHAATRSGLLALLREAVAEVHLHVAFLGD